MKATCTVKVKHTVSKAKEPSTSICSPLSGISGGRAIYTPFLAENYGAVTRRKARGIEWAAQKHNGHLWLKYPHNSRPLALLCSRLEEFAMKCMHTPNTAPLETFCMTYLFILKHRMAFALLIQWDKTKGPSWILSSPHRCWWRGLGPPLTTRL